MAADATSSGYPAALDGEPLANAMQLAAEHTDRYVASGGVGEAINPFDYGSPVMLLTTLGRRSGQPRRNPVVYGRKGEDYILAAAKGGADENPGWFLNLVAEPHVILQVMDRRFHATARVAQGDERTELFEFMLKVLPALHDYKASTSRQIPVVVVTPVE